MMKEENINRNIIKIILRNEERKYLGLTPIESHWERVDIKHVTLFFDGNVIRKKITHAEFESQQFSYLEEDVYVETTENRTIVLPKTLRGKPKKLNYTATTMFTRIGMYFMYNDGYVIIANATTQKTYYWTRIEGEENKKLFDEWFDTWKKETTEEDLRELEVFKNETRKKQKYKEGDVFAFKIGRRNYGFGKIIIDVVSRRKAEEFRKNKNYGLAHLMGTALIVKVYHKMSDTKDIDIAELERCCSLPGQAVMDNHIYYNQYPIIGHLPVSNVDMNDAYLSVSRSINYNDSDIAYLQYGLIYKQIPLSEYKKYEEEHWPAYRNEGIGFCLDIDGLEDCIKEKSNDKYFEINTNDLRAPEHAKDREIIFKLFGLDASLDYQGNLELCKQ